LLYVKLVCAAKQLVNYYRKMVIKMFGIYLAA